MKALFQNILIILSVVLLATSCYNEANRIYPTCADGILNQDEERVDCGGPNCDVCPPSCDNGILDYVDGWQEVGIDCGGPCEELGQLCCENGIWDINPEEPTLSESWVDCKLDGLAPGDVGFNSECPICEECANGIQDGAETGIDCDDDDMSDCPPCLTLCDDGLLNGGEGPCVDCGGSCGTCDDSHCTNGVQDNFPNDPSRSETAIDCGGCACPPCLLLCTDGIQNGEEEAIDCGGDDCVACNDIVLCGDGLLNGFETGVDCYDGTEQPPLSACPPCNTLCTDAQQNGFETDTDCGGPECQPCGNDEVGYLSYEVDGVFYESQFTSIQASRAVGTISIPDAILLQGGLNHPIIFTLIDDDLTFNQWGRPSMIVSNQSLTDNSTILFTDIDGIQYQAETHLSGINITFNPAVQFTAPFGTPPTGTPGGILSGTFDGTLKSTDGSGDTITITNGMFSTTFVN